MPIVALSFFVIMLFKFIGNQKYIRMLWILNRETTEERRKNISVMNYLADPATLKELILSQGTKFLEKKFDEYVNYMIGQITLIRKKWNITKIVNSIIESFVFGWGIIIILQKVIGGIISIGRLTFEIRALRIFSDSFGDFMDNLVRLRELAIKLSDVQELFIKYNPENDGTFKLMDNAPSIKFENVFLNMQIPINSF